ncbi:heterochromatin protein 1D [Drosophila willistoni]|uniref:Heterochromatin protein 1D n=1 Tax=Drosophila willistoni TaxID=7260 RepID=B4MIS6_DROWI|nr:heterochromatin protein 1D [Drosophila willistoni]
MSLKRDASGSVSLIGHARVKTIKKEPANNKPPPKSNEPSISPVEYTVEKIIGKRFWNGRPQLLIKWFGYPEEESTWEPQENMGNCIELLTDFEAELHKKQMKQEAIIKTERLEASSASPKKPIKKRSSSKLYTTEIDEANLLMKMDKLQIKPSSAPLKPKRKLSSYEHRSFFDLSSDSSGDGETEKPLYQTPSSGKASGASSPYLSAVSKYNSLEFIKEQARKWRSRKGKQHQKLRGSPTSRPGKPMKPRNLDDSIEIVMKRLHCGTDNRQENLPSTPTTPKCEPNLEDNYCRTRSGNKRKRWEPWRVSPRPRKTPYGLARGRPLDKVIHHFKMGKLVFLYVNWQGMSITDVILLDNLIDIYPQQIIKYMETIKVVMY